VAQGKLFMMVSSTPDQSISVSRFKQLITGKRSSGQENIMQETNRINSPIDPSSRSSTSKTLVNRSISIDS
jgi:hypothetical protein